MRSTTTICFPSRCSTSRRSIEIILAPIIGGIGTLFGPILGAFVLTGLAETLTALMAPSASICRAPSRCSTALLLVVIVALPEGVWPWLARRLGVMEGPK